VVEKYVKPIAVQQDLKEYLGEAADEESVPDLAD